MRISWFSRGGRRPWLWVGVSSGLAVMLMAVSLAAGWFNEPLRRSVEEQMNARLEGYTVRLGAARLRPVRFGIDLRDLTVTQDANPDPPVMRLPLLVARVHWQALFHARLVGHIRIKRPALDVNLTHLRREAEDPTPVAERGWQDALQAAYPLRINRLDIDDADVTYTDGGAFKPLKLSRVNIHIENIRNIRSRERTYPSEMHLDAVVFERGHLVFDGQADFLAEPHPGARGSVALDEMQLDYFQPVSRRYNVAVGRGSLSAKGEFEYAPSVKTAVLSDVTVSKAELEYQHSPRTAQAERATAARTARAAREATDRSDLTLAIERLRVVDSTFAFVNAAANPPYRLYWTGTTIEVVGLGNHRADHPARLTVRGKFMGSGATELTAAFNPDSRGGDLSAKVAIDATDMVAMNDILRAYGKFDVVAGTFSLYAETSVKDGAITGYVKPLFKDIKAYDPVQDRDKSFAQKLKERLVGGVSKLLKNRPRREIATKVDLSGRLDNPKTSTWQVLGGLIQNAFFKAILPGFDRAFGPAERGSARAPAAPPWGVSRSSARAAADG